MLDSLQATGIVLASWVLVAVAPVGTGLWIARACGLRLPDAMNVLRCFWTGLGACIGAAQLWHLVRPMDGWFALLAGVVGATGLVAARRDLLRIARMALGPRRRAVLVACLVLGWLAWRATGPPRFIDSEIYHLSSVEWALAYPILPGLGNVHDRLGFNASIHLLSAALESSLWRGRSHHVVNSLLAAVLVLQVLIAARRMLERPDDRRVVDGAFHLMLLTPIVAVAVSSNISSPSTDAPAMLLLLAGASSLVGLAVRTDADASETAFLTAACTLALTASATVKLTTVVFAAFASLAALALLRARVDRRSFVRTAAALILTCGAIMATWAGRTAVLTGYPLFPLPVLRTNLDWSLPPATVRLEIANVRADARHVLGPFLDYEPGWPRLWLRGVLTGGEIGYVVLPLLLAAAGAAAIAYARLRARVIVEPARRALGLLLPAGAGILVWAWQAPQPRMGVGPLWVVAAAVCAAAAGIWVPGRGRRAAWLIAVAGASLGLAPIWGWLVLGALRPAIRAAPVTVLGMPPGPDHGLHPVPKVDTLAFTTRSGLQLGTNAVGDGPFAAPLPCTPFPSHRLELRTPGSIAGGFRTSGAPGPSLAPASARAVLDFLAQHAQPGDHVYTNANATEVRAALLADGAPGIVVVEPATGQPAPLDDLRRTLFEHRSAGRIWFVVADGPWSPGFDDLQAVTYVMQILGEIRAQRHLPGVSVYLYETVMRPPADAPQPVPARR